MKFLQRIEKLAILKLLIWLALRDEDISREELSFLEDTALQMKIDPLPTLRKSGLEDFHTTLQDINTDEGKQVLLELLIKMSFADGIYDARERLAIANAATAINIAWSAVENIEHDLVEKLRNKLLASSNNTLDTYQEPQSWDFGKVAQIAGMTFAGGAVVALTGGLAAPVLGGVVGSAFLGLSGAAATSAGLAFLGGGSLAAGGLGTAGGITLVTTALGACGAGVAGWKTNHLLGDIKEWDIQHVGGEGLHICLGVSGFLQQSEESIDVWSVLQQSFPNACNYALKWESKKQHDVFEVISSISSKGLSGAVLAGLAQSATKKAFGMAALPLTALSILDVIDNPWGVAKNRADQAGEMLGNYIADGGFGGLPVTIIGYSLGTRVIIAALDQLAKRGASGKIFDVYLLAGAVAQDDPRLASISEVVAGNIVNVYSKNDLVLAYVYRTAEWLSRPIGIEEVNLDRVLNLDATEIVDGHLSYKKHLTKILSEINVQLGRPPHGVCSDKVTECTTSSLIETLKSRINQVPGMTPANRADFQHSEPYLKFQNGVQVHTWKNAMGVDHVFICNEDRLCVYGGYVGWIHSSGLEVTLQVLHRDYAEELV